MLLKKVLRTVKKSIARYLAILSIMALGVGFFAGLRVTQKAMLKTVDEYINELSLYDFKLVSTLGLTDDDVEAFKNIDGITSAAGSFSSNVICQSESGSDIVLHAHTLLENINGLDIVSGRLPEKPNECVVDAHMSDANIKGNKIVLSDNNTEDDLSAFAYREYTVVGKVASAEYMSFERGTTSLGNGSVAGFMYLKSDGFVYDCYTEIYLTTPQSGEIYSDEYDNALQVVRKKVEPLLEERADLRYNDIYSKAEEEIQNSQSELDSKKQELAAMSAMSYLPQEMREQALAEIEEGQKKIDEAREKLSEIKRPTVFTLDRSSNIGYASLDSDTAIVSGVAKVFPLFFLLVAALVCITTITRMVSEQRTENGVLKALGYGDAAIIGQYLFYAGSASVIGCIIGFALGSRFMPMALWQVYRIMYPIYRPIAFVPDFKLFALCLAIYMLCALGATWLVCHKDLRESAAQLIRPKAPSAGKRIFLEKIGFVWRRIKFLHKVSIRNILRYKKRMFMMIIGIGGCTALLLTGFGIRDSIRPIADFQFDEISLYDAEVSFLENVTDKEKSDFSVSAENTVSDITYLYTKNADVIVNDKSIAVNSVVFNGSLDGFVNTHQGENKLDLPKSGEALINYRLAKENGISLSDTVEVYDEEMGKVSVRVSGVFDNYIYDYIYINSETFEEQLGTLPPSNTAYVKFNEGMDEHEAGAVLLGLDNVAGVNISLDMRTRVGNMLESLDYIVLIVLVCAGALAFIVLYNLTNITITERTREIATLKVLGFYANEQNSYVFRENIVLTAISALCGIPMGIALLNYVMAQIKISTIYFDSRLSPESYVWAILLTFVFTLLVDITLTFKTKRINMAEAMKAVE